MSKLDFITLEVIQNSLQAISDEMFAAMRKTAMSPIIYEVLDMGTAVTDGHGNLATSGAGIPAFVAVLDKAVQRIIELNQGDIRPGDVFATNDPFFGGVTHLNDVVLAMPVFVEGELVAWTANIAHWNDVGGMVPGSMSNEAREIYQEGLRLPAVKIVDQGQPVRAVMEILRANTRLPDFLWGDLWAGVAAVRLGARRIQDLAAKYGKDVFVQALDHFMAYGEEVSRRALRELPKGKFYLEEEQDDGRIFKVTVEIRDDRFVIDLRDNPDQHEGPYNLCRDATLIACQLIFKNVTDPFSTVANAGTFRPLEVLTRPGSVFDAQPPAAFGFYYEVEIRVYDLIWRCLAPYLEDRLPAGHFASICGTVIGGPHPDTGRHFTIVEPELGGWGASRYSDGNSALFSGFHGETFNCPAEVAEARYGLYVEQLRLNDEPGGEGYFRGGKGIVLDYRVRSDGCFLTIGYTRSKQRPWALAGGREGSPNYVEIFRKDGRREVYSQVTALPLNRGDLIRIHTGNGGGYGDPRSRPREKVLEDLKNGYITSEIAREVYGLEV
ncbi:5-oxoprolinase (ATP-hydrolyzing) (plasmid) [Thermus thermophilus SG0.5JP17-16]|uniref:5-oxoprolinase (ATP-hydrolyzing) n=1 Tax=Thermus thermophilus (strain SG0.5JP17-16) TaxID=762633 RepID=F6DIP2_THETG|nr:hydantoinase B/oxoprolinase family protein [Thermus thermophilus]AEG34708.1 5-oxoprolinase (ATP-hydrolyzing) [Thermus thermophilus SG0.5JP17-16]